MKENTCDEIKDLLPPCVVCGIEWFHLSAWPLYSRAKIVPLVVWPCQFIPSILNTK